MNGLRLLSNIAANNLFRKHVDLNRRPGFAACVVISLIVALLLVFLIGPGSAYFDPIRIGALAYGFGILVVVFPMAAAEIMFKQDELNGQIDIIRLSFPDDRTLLSGYVWASLHRGRVLFSILASWAILMSVALLSNPQAAGLLGVLGTILTIILWYTSVLLWSGILAHMRAFYLKWEYDRAQGAKVTRNKIVWFVGFRSVATLLIFAPILVAPLLLDTLLETGLQIVWFGGLLLVSLLFSLVASMFWQAVVLGIYINMSNEMTTDR